MSQRLATSATRTTYGQVYDASTPNERDHAFSGIMRAAAFFDSSPRRAHEKQSHARFDVRCRELLPLAHIEITSVAVRGDLGPMRVFATANAPRFDFSVPRGSKEAQTWTCVYSKLHEPSMDDLVHLQLAMPLIIESGKAARIYVHSGLTHSAGGRCPDAIVYASQTTSVTTEDQHLQILPGMAHTSPKPFSDARSRRGASSARVEGMPPRRARRGDTFLGGLLARAGVATAPRLRREARVRRAVPLLAALPGGAPEPAPAHDAPAVPEALPRHGRAWRGVGRLDARRGTTDPLGARRGRPIA